MDYQKSFGQTVYRLRREKGISQEQFALRSKIDRRYMSDIENGRRNVSLDIIVRIANTLDIKPSELLKEVEK